VHIFASGKRITLSRDLCFSVRRDDS